MAEADDEEVKSQYDGAEEERLQLVKTITAMANTRGGKIRLERITVMPFQLDSARLDDGVNRYVQARVGGISSESAGTGMTITVRESTQKPHVFVQDGRYRDQNGRDAFVFHRGQVWVRHSSKNETASGDDVGRMVRESLAHILAKLSMDIKDGGLPVTVEVGGGGLPMHMTDADGIPVHISDTPGAIAVVPNLEANYPHTNTTLARAVERSANWVRLATMVLGCREKLSLSYPVRSGTGRVMLWRYTERTLVLLLETLTSDPDWDPARAARSASTQQATSLAPRPAS